MHDLRHALYHHIQRLSLSDHEKQKTGDLLVRVTSDIDAVQDFVSSASLGLVLNILTLLGMLGVMLYLNWRFTFVALSVAPVLFLVVYSLTRRIKRAAREVKKKESEIASVVQKSLTSMRVIKAFAREEYEEQRLDKESLESVDMALRARSIKARLSPLVDVLVAVGTCIVLWYGAHLVLRGELTSGALLVFILYLGKMYRPMRDLSKMTDTLSKASVGFERIREVLETESQVRDLPGARLAPKFKGRIAFENVSFGYVDSKPVLRNLDLEIEAGQFVALVGPTGSGKSTMMGLIARFYDPLSGVIRIDGQEIRNFTLKSLRQQISFVLQETILFRSTIWENIAYGRPGVSHNEIVRAAKLANAHEFIVRLRGGYDSVVGERGETLSGGQRQRIAIARAIIRDTPIFLLDEPSTGLDAASEQLVFEALELDVLWSIFVLLGIEKVRIVPGITATNPFDLYYMPYTHSLVAALGWSFLAIIIYKVLSSHGGWSAAAIVGAGVFSHWILDLLVHRPDLPLYDNTMKVGFGLWNFPIVAFGLEVVFLFVGLYLYLRATKPVSRGGRYGMLAFAFLMLPIQGFVFFGSPPASDKAAAITALGSYAVFAAVAFWLEKKRA